MNKILLLCALLCTSQFSMANCSKDQELTLFALNMYHEARGEGLAGMAAVGQVVIERMKSGRYPDGVCSVIRQYHAGVCHFSWLCDGRSNIPANKDQWYLALVLAKAMLYDGYRSQRVQGATMYYACTYINPPKTWNWRKLKRVTRLGNHCFYSERGVS